MASKLTDSIEPFNERSESFASYTERLKMYFEINDVKDDTKKPALLSLISSQTYSLLWGLTAPTKPKEKTFDTIFTNVHRRKTKVYQNLWLL